MSPTEITIQPQSDGEADACEGILRTLPDWFGIDESIVRYRKDIEAFETHVVRRDGELVGFYTLKPHGEHTSEIHVMALLAPHHRRGLGRRMVEHAEALLRERGVEYLQVKTLGPSRPDEGYERTRRFYEARGFAPLEEIHGLWEGNPCLVLVKRL